MRDFGPKLFKVKLSALASTSFIDMQTRRIPLRMLEKGELFPLLTNFCVIYVFASLALSAQPALAGDGRFSTENLAKLCVEKCPDQVSAVFNGVFSADSSKPLLVSRNIAIKQFNCAYLQSKNKFHSI